MNLRKKIKEVLEKNRDSNKAEAVIICDIPRCFISLSIKGAYTSYTWSNNTLRCNNSNTELDIGPMAAESFIRSEFKYILELNNIDEEDVLLCSPELESLDKVTLNPPSLGKITPEIEKKKEKLYELYCSYLENYELTKSVTVDAVNSDLIDDLLSLIRLKKV